MADVSATQAFTMGVDALYLSKRPLPTAPTGYYDWQITTDPADDREGHSAVTNLVNRVQNFKAKGKFKPNLAHIDAFLDAHNHPTSIDDRKGAFATGLGILARLDPHSGLAKKMNDSVIHTLYNSVPHPPASYLGPNHCFRHADGGWNNLQDPDLGRAGTPYSRSVQGKSGLPRSSLPDAGLVFDTILRKHDHQDHAGGMSSLIFAFAAIVTHSLFRTDHRNTHINNASSFLDLSPLYGDNQIAQDKVRDKAAGRGLLYPDTFSEERLLLLPAAANVLLVIFSRNHNYIAEKILKINERGLWSDPPPVNEARRAIQDEQLFQTARLINCGHFMAAIMGDYVAGFLGSSEGCNWNMNAFDPIQGKEHNVPRGQGNHCSVEFNILYRWHATTSQQDEKYTEGIFNKVFNNKPFDQLSLRDLPAISKVFQEIEPNPAKREFGGLKRGHDGRFSDDDLANVLQTATENPAGAFRGRGTPPVLRIVEIMGIEQSRAWGVCTMNEFRKHLGLKVFESFEDWNPDLEISAAARQLYGHIDNLELYAGLQAEATMPLTDGSRFACGYTTTRAVLGDAIALVRGDRFYTSDFTPINLTTWGFQDCQRDMNNGAAGGEIPKLLLRHLPRHYTYNNVYSLYPFFTPTKMQKSLEAQGIASKYTFQRPVPAPLPIILNTFIAIKTVFNDPARFKVVYPKNGYGSIVNFDEIMSHDRDRGMILKALFPTKESLGQYVSWFGETTVKKIQEKSWRYSKVPGNYVDIVKDVINSVSVHFVVEKITGIPLKTKENPSGLYTEMEVFDMLKTLYSAQSLMYDDPEHGFALQEAAAHTRIIMNALITKSLLQVAPSLSPNLLGKIVAGTTSYVWPSSKKSHHPFLQSLTSSGRPLNELLGNIIGLAVNASVSHAHAAVHVIDFYLDGTRERERQHLSQLVTKQDAESADLIRGYVYEAMRLRPQFPGLWRKAVTNATIPQGEGLPDLEIKTGDHIWASFRNAHINALDFPNPKAVDPRRPVASYNLNGAGFHKCPGATFAQQTICEMVKAVFKLKNVRRAAGEAGKLTGFTEVINGTETEFYIQRNGSIGSWPGSMHIIYDD